MESLAKYKKFIDPLIGERYFFQKWHYLKWNWILTK
jgi:hypothetical protein